MEAEIGRVWAENVKNLQGAPFLEIPAFEGGSFHM
jgi:hypothetical protein